MFPKKIRDFSGNFPMQCFNAEECQKLKSHHFKINKFQWKLLACIHLNFTDSWECFILQ